MMPVLLAGLQKLPEKGERGLEGVVADASRVYIKLYSYEGVRPEVK